MVLVHPTAERDEVVPEGTVVGLAVTPPEQEGGGSDGGGGAGVGVGPTGAGVGVGVGVGVVHEPGED